MGFKNLIIYVIILKQGALFSQSTLFSASLNIKSNFSTMGVNKFTLNELPNFYFENLSHLGNIKFSGITWGGDFKVNFKKFSFGVYYSLLNTINGYSCYTIKNQINNDQFNFSLLTIDRRNSFGALVSSKFENTYLKNPVFYEFGMGCSTSNTTSSEKNYKYYGSYVFSDSSDIKINKKTGFSFHIKLIKPINYKGNELFNFFISYEQGLYSINRAYYDIKKSNNQQINLICNSKGSQFSIGISKKINFYKL